MRHRLINRISSNENISIRSLSGDLIDYLCTSLNDVDFNHYRLVCWFFLVATEKQYQKRKRDFFTIDQVFGKTNFYFVNAKGCVWRLKSSSPEMANSSEAFEPQRIYGLPPIAVVADGYIDVDRNVNVVESNIN